MAKKASRKSSARAAAPERVISPVLGCTPKRLPQERLVAAAAHARRINPQNFAPVHNLTRLMPAFAPDAARLAVVTAKYWGVQGVRLSVGFLDGANSTLRRMILEHMNAWSRTANVKFMETSDSFSARVRISRMGGLDGGYWSYVGTDIDLIPPGEPTMNLEGFTEHTLESEFRRVVRHEAGHTLGFPHEHMRDELVARIDEAKAIEYFGRTQGWSPAEVRQQVLTPLENGSILGTPNPDPFSIMCYQISGEITIDGQPIIGGNDIDEEDRQFAARIYPKPPQAPTESDTSESAGEPIPAPISARISEKLVADYLTIQKLQAQNLAAILGNTSRSRGVKSAAARSSAPSKTLASKDDLQTLVIETIEDETGTEGVGRGTSFADDLDLDARAVKLLYIPVRDAIIAAGATIQRFTSDDFAGNDTVGDAIDALADAIPGLS